MTAQWPQPQEQTALATYAYSYPHKSSYRPLEPPVRIDAAWQYEDKSKLSLYVHVPFCEMRCGFCNLFTASQPHSDVVTEYLATLERQIQVVGQMLPGARFPQLCLGGGTPTFLSAAQLERLFRSLDTVFGCSPRNAHASIETSPNTADQDRLNVLADVGVERVSIGVQSFDDAETSLLGRPQQIRRVHQAIERIRRLPFRILNIDLIYGHPEQSVDSWMASLRAALRHFPEELYLYPLYLRPETGLARSASYATPHRVDLYRRGRDFLLANGYRQVSLRCFRLPIADPDADQTDYACQTDGMVGLGCGARSYTRELHYATRFATTQAGVKAILTQWIRQIDAELAQATHGVRLSQVEQRRRFLILSLLQATGLSRLEYATKFHSNEFHDLPELRRLEENGLLVASADKLVLTTSGLENSDYIGPLLYSTEVRERLVEFTQR